MVVIDERFSVGPQPDSRGLRRLAGQGCQAIVNLRSGRADDEPISVVVEGELVRCLGMRYMWLPVPGREPLREEWVARLRTGLSTLPWPIYIHCRSGERASALTWSVVADEWRLHGNEALTVADSIGVSLSADYRWQPPLRRFIRERLPVHQPRVVARVM